MRYPRTPAVGPGRITVVGAGVAGCSVARALAERGRQVIVVDQHHVASGASGNPAALVQPVPRVGNDTVSEWIHTGFGFAKACASRFSLPWTPVDVVHHHARSYKRQQAVLEGEDGYFSSSNTGAYRAHGAVIEPVGWCHGLLNHPGIVVEEACEHRATSGPTVWCTSHAVPIPSLDVQPVRGQIGWASTSTQARRAHSHSGYVLPLGFQQHLLGATFDREDVDERVREADWDGLVADLADTLPQLAANLGPMEGGRTSFRGVTPEHLPFVGPWVDVQHAVSHWNQEGRPYFPSSSYRKGHYVCVGHGSRGFTTAWMAAELLASRMVGEEPSISARLESAVHTGRGVRRSMR